MSHEEPKSRAYPARHCSHRRRPDALLDQGGQQKYRIPAQCFFSLISSFNALYHTFFFLRLHFFKKATALFFCVVSRTVGLLGDMPSFSFRLGVKKQTKNGSVHLEPHAWNGEPFFAEKNKSVLRLQSEGTSAGRTRLIYDRNCRAAERSSFRTVGCRFHFPPDREILGEKQTDHVKKRCSGNIFLVSFLVD